MAVDSIIASPTNSVRVMVADASGCCARELSAVATALPSPSAGPRTPMPVVMPAVTIDATAIMVMLSKVPPYPSGVLACKLAGTGCGSDVDRRENAEDVGLHHAGQQPEQCHHQRKE